MNDLATAKPPTSYWVVAGLGLLWNLFGAGLYMLAKLNPEMAVEGATPEMKQYIANMPVWAHIGWSLGVWGSFLGSVLMVMRSRHSATAFLVSLIGALVSFGAQAQAGVLEVGLAATIVVIIALLWWFSRRAQGQGLLK